MIDRNKQIRNIYYMIAYAFQSLSFAKNELGSEKFEYIADLFAEILAVGVSAQLKRGLYREYVPISESLTTLKGKLDINGTIGHRLKCEMQLSCNHDEYSANNLFNRILKTAMLLLIRHSDVKGERRSGLKKAVLFFSEIDTVEPSSIRWNTLVFGKRNQSYRMLMGVCYLTLNGLLYSENGKRKMSSFIDEQQMNRLYEKFILEYYRFHYKNISANANKVPWRLESGDDEFLPTMQTDITLQYQERTLIIDAKYYSQVLISKQDYSKKTIPSGNLYQIFTYVKNADINDDGKVSGMLLYAKTDEEISPDKQYTIAGNSISVKTLDLNLDFKDIAAQLNFIAEKLIAPSAA